MPRLRELPHKPRLPNHLVRPLDQAQNLGQVDLVQPTDGNPCPSGWMNIGAGYCKKKTLGIF